MGRSSKPNLSASDHHRRTLNARGSGDQDQRSLSAPHDPKSARVDADCVDQDKRRTETSRDTSTHKHTQANTRANRVAVSTSHTVERPCPSSDGSLRADTGRSPSQRGLRPRPTALGSMSPDGHSDDFSTLDLNLATCRPIGTGRKHQRSRRPPRRTAKVARFGMKANRCSEIGIGLPRLMRGPSPENKRRRPYLRQTRASALGGHPRGP